MSPRLLTLLNHIETALANHGSRAVSRSPLRTMNFHKGMARMAFADGSGSILLQNFTLADGQICVRAVFSWEGRTETAMISIYPREDFDWLGAADQIASAWLGGQGPTAAAGSVSASEAEASQASIEEVAATG
jgi:hypothetical protein